MFNELFTADLPNQNTRLEFQKIIYNQGPDNTLPNTVYHSARFSCRLLQNLLQMVSHFTPKVNIVRTRPPVVRVLSLCEVTCKNVCEL